MIGTLILFLLPVIEIGPSYYVSGQSAIAMLVATHWTRAAFPVFLSSGAVWFIAGLMLLSLFGSSAIDVSRDFTRYGREIIIFVMMSVFLRAASQGLLKIDPMSMLTPTIIFCGFLFGFVALQTVFLQRQIYFGFPETWYHVEGFGTIAGELNLLYSKIRPNGPFSEPSYLGYILVSLLVLLRPLLGHVKRMTILLTFILLTGILSRSFLFLVSVIPVLIIPNLRNVTPMAILRVVFSLATVILILFLLGGNDLLARFSGTFDASDESSNGRILLPLQISAPYLLSYPFGAPLEELPVILEQFLTGTVHGYEILNNGILNTMFEFGLPGVLAIGAVFFATRDGVIRWYLVVAASQNGSFFAVDKFAVVSFVSIGYFASRRFVSDRARSLDAANPVFVDNRPTSTRQVAAWAGRSRPVRAGSDLPGGRASWPLGH